MPALWQSERMLRQTWSDIFSCFGTWYGIRLGIGTPRKITTANFYNIIFIS